MNSSWEYVLVMNYHVITKGWCHLIEGRLEVKLPATWRDKKAKVGRVRKEKRRREKIRDGEEV